MYTSTKLAKNIKERAKEEEITIRELLEECDLGKNTISDLNHGKAIAFDSLAKIADVLECSVDSLIGRNCIYTRNEKEERDEERLLTIYNQLTDEGQRALMNFAEFTANDMRYQKYTDVPKEA